MFTLSRARWYRPRDPPPSLIRLSCFFFFFFFFPKTWFGGVVGHRRRVRRWPLNEDRPCSTRCSLTELYTLNHAWTDLTDDEMLLRKHPQEFHVECAPVPMSV